MSLSLYRIQDDLQQLAELRTTAELEGDCEALKVIDQQIAEYLTREVSKIDSYVEMMLQCSDSIDAIDKQIERLQDHKRREKAMLERLKANALMVMQRFNVTELRTPLNALRRQNNGGVEPLEIAAWPKDSSGRYVPLDDAHIAANAEIPVKTFYIPNTELIREALKRGENIPGAKLLERGQHVRVL